MMDHFISGFVGFPFIYFPKVPLEWWWCIRYGFIFEINMLMNNRPPSLCTSRSLVRSLALKIIIIAKCKCPEFLFVEFVRDRTTHARTITTAYVSIYLSVCIVCVPAEEESESVCEWTQWNFEFDILLYYNSIIENSIMSRVESTSVRERESMFSSFKTVGKQKH